MEEVNKTPLVSICCTTYNHEPYIRQCLDGFLMQETSFLFEVIIHDDASMDGTTDIVREYERNYPDIIKPIYQNENQFSKGIRLVATFIIPRVQGKYIALCEGDDYWTDPLKLQKQVDFLEGNPDFSICFHPVVLYDQVREEFVENNMVRNVPSITDIRNLAKSNFINTVSVMYRFIPKVFIDICKTTFLPAGDYHLHMLHAQYGKIKKINDTMAVYRLHDKGNWSSKPIEYTYSIWLKLLESLLMYFHNNREVYNILKGQYRVKKIQLEIGKLKNFIKRRKILYSLFKSILSIKKVGIIETLNRINSYLYNRGQIRKKWPSFDIDRIISNREKVYQKSQIFPQKKMISIITPLYNTPKDFLISLIESVKAQTYTNWELCLADGSDGVNSEIGNLCKDYSKHDERIKYKKLEKNYGISGNSNKAIEMSSGDYLGLLDHDDVLHPSALYEAMKVICYEEADFIYSDEAVFSGKSIISLFHKPDYSIDTLLSYNYICHFAVFSRSIMNKAGTFRSKFDGSQDHDLFLRYTDVASKIYHIPQVLYFWRKWENSITFDTYKKFYASKAGMDAVKEHLISQGISAIVNRTIISPNIYRISCDLKERPLISIILLPNKNIVSMLGKCIKSIIEKTTYNNYEIVIIEESGSKDEYLDYLNELKEYKNVNVINWPENEYNYSKIGNFSVKFSNGPLLVFLNNNIEIITPNWIEEMLMYSRRNDVGAVGAKLYYSDNTIQHAGIVLGMRGAADNIYNGVSKKTLGYMNRLHYVQNMSAVSSSCMMIRKSVLEEVGNFDTEYCNSYSDIDLCMKIRRLGYLIVWTPYAEAYYHDSKMHRYFVRYKNKKILDKDSVLFKSRWAKELATGDPYYNRNFSLKKSNYSLA